MAHAMQTTKYLLKEMAQTKGHGIGNQEIDGLFAFLGGILEIRERLTSPCLNI